jgi:hypothetical protein
MYKGGVRACREAFTYACGSTYTHTAYKKTLPICRKPKKYEIPVRVLRSIIFTIAVLSQLCYIFQKLKKTVTVKFISCRVIIPNTII